jgi:hypothetical protein
MVYPAGTGGLLEIESDPLFFSDEKVNRWYWSPTSLSGGRDGVKWRED